MSAASSHFVAQFSGSRGPTDPSGHVLTMGIPNGDAVGNEVGASDGQHASLQVDGSVELPVQMHPYTTSRRVTVEEQRSEHPLSNMSVSSAHFVAQFSGSRGPTDPSGHVVTTGIPSGDAVGNEVGASDGQHASLHVEGSVELPVQMHPYTTSRKDTVEVQSSEHPSSNTPTSSAHFVAQFSGSRGTDPSGHELTMGIPSGDGVGNEVGAPDGDRTEGGAGGGQHSSLQVVGSVDFPAQIHPYTTSRRDTVEEQRSEHPR